VGIDFIKDWLDIPVTQGEAGQYLFGDPGMGLMVLEREAKARVNDTDISIGHPLRKVGETVRLPWKNLAYFLGYRSQYLGPERLLMLRNMEEIPEPLRKIIEDQGKMSYKAGESVALALEGRNLELSGKTAFVDKISGRIMVPLRETAKALGAQFYGFPMERNSEIDKTMADHNYGLVDIGPDVKAIWILYLKVKFGGYI